MNIFITGSTGFIGRAVVAALAARGHDMTCGARGAARCISLPCSRVQAVDFSRDLDAAVWRPRLEGIEVLINAVGMIREGAGRTFEDLHTRAPAAMFSAARAAGVRRIVQVSALGADAGARSAYHLSKKAADDYLASLPGDWVIVQPSLVFGPGGASARLFTRLAALPWIPLPGCGDQRVQPIHLDDLVEAMVTLVETSACQRRIVPLVGPEPLSLANLLADLRASLGLGPARFVSVPNPIVKAVASVSSRISDGLLDRETLAMLERGNVADARPTMELLGRRPRPVSAFLPPDAGSSIRIAAELGWLLPILRWSIALVWIGTAIVSVAVFPLEDSLSLLARTGVPAAWGLFTLYAAASLDLVLGIASVSRWRSRRLWLVQIGLIAGYTLIISLRLPEYWLHPYGPVLKNLPMLAALALLYRLDRR